MFATAHNGVHATPYGNLSQFFAKAFGKLPEKEKAATEQEKTTTPFWEGVEHVFPSFSDNLSKAFSQLTETKQEDQQKPDPKVVIPIVVASQANADGKDKPNS